MVAPLVLGAARLGAIGAKAVSKAGVAAARTGRATRQRRSSDPRNTYRRHKNQEDGNRMRTANPDLNEESINNPITSPPGIDYTNSPIVSARSHTERSRQTSDPADQTTAHRSPYRSSTDSTNNNLDYAEQYTHQKNLARRKKIRQQQKAKDQKRSSYEAQAVNDRPDMHALGTALGRQLAKRALKKKGKTVHLAEDIGVKNAARIVVSAWWVTGQLLIFGAGMAFLAKGMIIGAVFAPLNILVDTVTGQSIPVGEMVALIGIGIGLFNFVVTTGILFGVYIAYRLHGVESLSGKYANMKRLLFFGAILLYFPLITQFIPWGLFWVLFVNYVSKE